MNLSSAAQPRLLICCSHFWPSAGGVEVAARQLAVELTARGWAVTVLTGKDPARTTHKLGDVRILEHSGAAGDVHLWSTFEREVAGEIESGAYDACLLIADPLNWIFGGLERVNIPSRTRIVCQPLINEDGLRFWAGDKGVCERFAKRLRRASAVTTLTEEGVDAQCARAMGVEPRFIPNAVPARSGSPIDFRARHGIPAGAMLLLQVANFWPVKNHPELIRQLTGLPGDWHLALVGNSAGHGDYLRRVQRLAEAEPRITLIPGLGPDDVAQAMQVADLLLVPSLGEVAPLVVLEAMSHGLPWVATPECGSVWEHAGGVVAALEEFPRIIDALGQNRELARRLGDLGQYHWRASYTPEVTTSAWVSLLAGEEDADLPGHVFEPRRATAQTAKEIRNVAGLGAAPRRRGLEDLGWAGGKGAISAAPAALDELGARPLVSVIVTTKERPRLLVDALSSLVAQTYDHWEAVVVNDGGDDVEETVSAIDPKGRIRYLRHPHSRGPSVARNTGISFSTGGVLCYLDDDDRFLCRHLATIVDALQHSGAEFVYTEAEYVDETIEDGRRVEQGRSHPFAGVVYSKGRLHVSNFIPINTWAHRRALLERTGVFDTTLRALEDWDLLLRVCQATEPVHVDEVTVEVRQRRKAQGEHLSQRQRTEFPALYRTLYRRYPVDFDPTLEQQRRQVLEDLDRGERPGVEADSPEAPGYETWLERHALKESDAQYMAERMMTEWRLQATFHLLITHCRGEEEALADTLDSLSAQLYRNWGISILSTHPAPAGWTVLPNVEWLQVDASPMEAVNAVALQSAADWFVLLEAGVRLAPEALFAWVDWLNLNRDWRLMYADEDRIGGDGRRHSPAFKPECNRDLLRSMPYMGDVLAVRADLLRAVGGYDLREGVAAYGLALQALELTGEKGIGHVPKVLVHSQDRFQRRRDDAAVEGNRRSVVVEHLDRCGEAADVVSGWLQGTHFVDYRLRGSERVSIVVPQRRERDTLGICVERVLSLTQYPDFEVIVVADASRAELPEDSRLRVVSAGQLLTYAEAVNRGVAVATGEFVLLLHDDCLVVQEHWLSRLVANGQRKGVGVVGARLVDADQRVSHAGLVLGLTGTVGRMGTGALLADPGYTSRLQVAQMVSAVSGACLLIRRSLFEQLGGMDSEGFPELFSDADLCMRAANSGLQIVWTPFVTLVGSALPRAVDSEAARSEKEELHARWLPRLTNDPAFNPNLSLADKTVSVETELDVSWDRPFRPRPRIWAFPLDDQGVGHYRVRAPLAALDMGMLAQVELLPAHNSARVVRVPNLPELLRAAPDTLLIQHGYLDLFLDWIPRYRRHTSTFVVFGQDDNMFEVPEKNANRGKLAHDIERRVAEAIGLCDRLIVTTEPLAEVYRRFASDIRVVPNHLEGWRWQNLRSLRRQGGRPRVGWAGAQQHLGDLDWLEPVVRALADEVEWVFMGMCPDELRPYVAEFHAPVPFSRYPDKLASLHLDLAIAPLEIHPFNEGKSDLRILEYGVLGWPVIATDIHPYRGKPVTLLANDPARWIAAIRERVHDLDALAGEGDNLKAWVLRHRLLDDHAGNWFEALFDDALLRRLGAAPEMAA